MYDTMKKNIMVFVVISLMISYRAFAQSFSIGARGGINIPNLTAGNSDSPLSEGYSSRLASDFAILAEFHLSKLFTLQPMIEYSQQGGKKNGFQAITIPDQYSQFINQNYVYADYNSTAKLDYLMIPVLAKFGWDLGVTSPFRFYVDAGPFVGFLLSAHQVTSGSSQVYLTPNSQSPLIPGAISFNADENTKDQLHNFNFGVSANIGLTYQFEKNSIFIEVGGNYGFINIQKDTKDGENRTGAANFTVGYTYTI